MTGLATVDKRRVARAEQNTTESNEHARRGDGATRLVVLWLCWVVLAVFLASVAIVDF